MAFWWSRFKSTNQSDRVSNRVGLTRFANEWSWVAFSGGGLSSDVVDGTINLSYPLRFVSFFVLFFCLKAKRPGRVVFTSWGYHEALGSCWSRHGRRPITGVHSGFRRWVSGAFFCHNKGCFEDVCRIGRRISHGEESVPHPLSQSTSWISQSFLFVHFFVYIPASFALGFFFSASEYFHNWFVLLVGRFVFSVLLIGRFQWNMLHRFDSEINMSCLGYDGILHTPSAIFPKHNFLSMFWWLFDFCVCWGSFMLDDELN